MDLDNERIMRLPEVLSLVGVSRSTLYAWMAKGRFLAGVQVGPRTRAWRARDVAHWLESLPPVDSPQEPD